MRIPIVLTAALTLAACKPAPKSAAPSPAAASAPKPAIKPAALKPVAVPPLASEADQVRAAAEARIAHCNKGGPGKVGHVVVEGDYALTDWDCSISGGEALFEKRGGAWALIQSGGGAMRASDIADLGVPQPTAQKLFDAMVAASNPPNAK